LINKPNIFYPNYQWNGELTNRSKTDLIVWHHSESGDVSALEIDSWHKNRVNDPFIGIGYNFVVHWDGSIETGRPIDKQGAHAYGINNRSIGICFTGRYDDSNNMPELQFNSGVQLTTWLLQIYPGCEIIGHRDAIDYGGDASSCPGQHFPFDEMKNKVLTEVIKVAEQWKLDIITNAKNAKLITSDHDPDEQATKWFVLATMLNLLKIIKG